ncbi:unnamed protein product [Prunus armeniaca]|uniref:Uncharacterized protein n=1 Tax=Prunus armeniaca TaxID=36596 RepID=A0A6J5WJ98_PRUAR|nr:unnamed protein product [Prunus armeniaca]
MNKLIAENEKRIQCLNVEKDNLEKRFASAKQEAEKTHEELTNMRSLKEEKETTITYLKSEVENLRTQHKEFKDTLYKEALAKESLRKQISQLQGQRKTEDCSEKKLKAATFHTSDENNFTDLLTELTLLKGRNKSMEKELKDMQERYSEISLRFAEVEGERQQLVMTVRNLRSSKKN